MFKKSYKGKISAVLICVMLLGNPGTIVLANELTEGINMSVSNTEDIFIPDVNLENEIRKELKVYDRKITVDDMKNLKKLEIYSKRVLSLVGLEHAVNIENLSVIGDYNKKDGVVDLSPIENLTKLTTLSLSHNKITNISQLQKLTNLKKLYLDSNSIEDITNLKYLVNLEELSIRDNKVTNLDPLAKLMKLRYLDAAENQISNINGLQDKVNLTNVTLSSNSINDISALVNLKNMEYLDLSTNQIEDISALDGFNKLIRLSISENRIEDISALSKCTQLEYLTLNNNLIKDLSAVETLVELKELYAFFNKITNISGVGELKNLESLNLTSNYIEDINELSKLTYLRELSLGNNNIKNIESLSNLKRLTNLNISSNKVKDISSLNNIVGLFLSAQDQSIILDTIEVIDGDVKIVKPIVGMPDSNIDYFNISHEGKVEGDSIIWTGISGNQDLEVTFKSNDGVFTGKVIQSINNSETEVNIPDKKLESAIKESLGVDKITNVNIKSLNSLNLNGKDIIDLTGLEKAINLSNLNLNGNKNINDYSPINELKNLTIIDISNNDIKEIDFLGGLTNIHTVYASDNKILDFSPLSSSNVSWITAWNQNVELEAETVKDKSDYEFIIPRAANQNGDNININNAYFTDGVFATNEIIANGKVNITIDTNADTEGYILIRFDNERISGEIRQPIKIESDYKDNIVIPDEKLASEIKNKLGINKEGKLTKRILGHIYELRANNLDIESIEGLQYAINLTTLELVGNKIKDIKPLEALEKLDSLSISGNRILDLSPIKGKEIKNISAVDQEIILDEVNVNDEDTYEFNMPILKGTNGEIITVDRVLFNDGIVKQWNTVRDNKANIKISVAGDSVGEITTDFGNYDINFSGVIKQKIKINSISTSLRNVKFNDKNVEHAVRETLSLNQDHTITTRDMKNLRYISLGKADETADLTGLEHATNLYSLNLYYGNIGNTETINNFKYLTSLGINNLKKSINLDFITTMPEINTVSFMNSNINNNEIAKLSNIETLNDLSISNSDFKDLSILKDFKQIKTLSLSANNIEDITPLSSLTSLERLSLDDNNIKDVSAIGNLRSLKLLNLKNNHILDISKINSELFNTCNINLLGQTISLDEVFVSKGSQATIKMPEIINNDGEVQKLDAVLVHDGKIYSMKNNELVIDKVAYDLIFEQNFIIPINKDSESIDERYTVKVSNDINMYDCDLDQNGEIDILDLSAASVSYNKSDKISDFNRDGIVDLYDLVMISKIL